MLVTERLFCFVLFYTQEAHAFNDHEATEESHLVFHPHFHDCCVFAVGIFLYIPFLFPKKAQLTTAAAATITTTMTTRTTTKVTITVQNGIKLKNEQNNATTNAGTFNFEFLKYKKLLLLTELAHKITSFLFWCHLPRAIGKEGCTSARHGPSKGPVNRDGPLFFLSLNHEYKTNRIRC